jgi:hypothetical protein
MRPYCIASIAMFIAGSAYAQAGTPFDPVASQIAAGASRNANELPRIPPATTVATTPGVMTGPGATLFPLTILRSRPSMPLPPDLVLRSISPNTPPPGPLRIPPGVIHSAVPPAG